MLGKVIGDGGFAKVRLGKLRVYPKFEVAIKMIPKKHVGHAKDLI